MKKIIALLGLVAGLVTGQAGWAVQLQVSGGKLMGATGVNVNGALYDVSFRDGTCIELFSGCDSNSDFLFQSFDDALSASAALLSQVFVNSPSGDFDDDPALTNGCSYPDLCTAITLNKVPSFDDVLALALNISRTSPGTDRAVGSSLIASPHTDSTDVILHTYAVWSRHPTDLSTPESIPLALTVALSCFAAVSMRKRR